MLQLNKHFLRGQVIPHPLGWDFIIVTLVILVILVIIYVDAISSKEHSGSQPIRWSIICMDPNFGPG